MSEQTSKSEAAFLLAQIATEARRFKTRGQLLAWLNLQACVAALPCLDAPISSWELSKAAGICRKTAQNALDQLEELGEVAQQPGTSPTKVYRVNRPIAGVAGAPISYAPAQKLGASEVGACVKSRRPDDLEAPTKEAPTFYAPSAQVAENAAQKMAPHVLDRARASDLMIDDVRIPEATSSIINSTLEYYERWTGNPVRDADLETARALETAQHSLEEIQCGILLSLHRAAQRRINSLAYCTGAINETKEAGSGNATYVRYLESRVTPQAKRAPLRMVKKHPAASDRRARVMSGAQQSIAL